MEGDGIFLRAAMAQAASGGGRYGEQVSGTGRGEQPRLVLLTKVAAWQQCRRDLVYRVGPVPGGTQFILKILTLPWACFNVEPS
ncbi:hypothetical protein AL051_04050 [Pseudomonas amygdali pv. dendropanacis]|nr:hypothetical protein AL051_04050 [Pseudomonas amygdali pv. dendropanacis]